MSNVSAWPRNPHLRFPGGAPAKILFIRRDNIGDLICTTPAIRAARQSFPNAVIGILVNSYNADVVLNNPDIDEIYIYEKSKHVPDKSKLSVWLDNFRVLSGIRKRKYDVAIACGSSPTLERYAYMTGAKYRVGFVKEGSKGARYNVPLAEPGGDMHEVEKTFEILRPLGIQSAAGEMVLVPDQQESLRFDDFLKGAKADPSKPVLAVPISARIRENKWPLEKFMSLFEDLISSARANVVLLWAPGPSDHPTFPGDDDAARKVIHRFGSSLLPYPTPTLKALIAAIAGSDAVLTLDTGSLHMAAAAGKPTLALMTKRKAVSWYPWKTPNIVVASDKSVSEIEKDDVLKALGQLLGGIKHGS